MEQVDSFQDRDVVGDSSSVEAEVAGEASDDQFCSDVSPAWRRAIRMRCREYLSETMHQVYRYRCDTELTPGASVVSGLVRELIRQAFASLARM